MRPLTATSWRSFVRLAFASISTITSAPCPSVASCIMMGRDLLANNAQTKLRPELFLHCIYL